jgi:hypothetical protein
MFPTRQFQSSGALVLPAASQNPVKAAPLPRLLRRLEGQVYGDCAYTTLRKR